MSEKQVINHVTNNANDVTNNGDLDIEVKDGSKTVDTRFGVCGFKPQAIQRFATVGWFTGWYSVASIMMSTIIVYVNSQITTLERQFGFNSKQTGLIMAANDIGYLICVLFVSHSAKMLHIPRALGTAAIIFGLSGLMCSLPHFLYGSVFLDDDVTTTSNTTSFPVKQTSNLRANESIFGQMCSFENRTKTFCEEEGDNQDNSDSTQRQAAVSSLAIIVVGMMLQGFGKAPRASLSVIYIDDNTNRVKSGFYFGIFVALSIMGPAVAFAMGGIFTRIYVTLGETNLYPKHPKWIGAWWLGFLVFGATSVFVSIPLFCFPAKLPRKEKSKKPMKPIYKGVNLEDDVEKDNDALVKKEPEVPNNHHSNNHHHHHNNQNHNHNHKVNETQPKEKRSLNKSIIHQAKLFLASLFRILTNPIFDLMVASSCFILFMVGGSSAYSPKYLERIFDLPAYQANYIMAGKTLLASCVGTFIGGYLTKYYKMTAKKALHFIVFLSFISTCLSLISMFAYCDQPATYNWPGETDASLQTCNGGCHCEDNRYFPICGGDKKTYYSPCMAGCIDHFDGNYSNCTCIEGGTATPGICPYGCNQVYFFAIVSGLRSLFGTGCIIPKVTVLIRTVEERDKSLALGVSSFMSSLLGWLLGPVAFGIIIDGICSLWDRKCDVIGRCLLYDNNLFRWKLNGYSSLGVGGAFLCQLATLAYSWRTGCLDDIGVDGRQDEEGLGKKGKEGGNGGGKGADSLEIEKLITAPEKEGIEKEEEKDKQEEEERNKKKREEEGGIKKGNEPETRKEDRGDTQVDVRIENERLKEGGDEGETAEERIIDEIDLNDNGGDDGDDGDRQNMVSEKHEENKSQEEIKV